MTSTITERELLADIGMDDARIQDCERNLATAKGSRLARLVKLMELRYGVRVGRIALVKGKEFKITEVHPSMHAHPDLKGVPRKKDNTWSIDPRYLYGWELVPETIKI